MHFLQLALRDPSDRTVDGVFFLLVQRGRRSSGLVFRVWCNIFKFCFCFSIKIQYKNAISLRLGGGGVGVDKIQIQYKSIKYDQCVFNVGSIDGDGLFCCCFLCVNFV